jgi:hypothetical protein
VCLLFEAAPHSAAATSLLTFSSPPPSPACPSDGLSRQTTVDWCGWSCRKARGQPNAGSAHSCPLAATMPTGHTNDGPQVHSHGYRACPPGGLPALPPRI